MHSKPQRYTFYSISILSILIVGVAWLRLSDTFGIADEIRHSGLSVSLALFLIAWVYPLKTFDDNGSIIGMHREALRASGFFIFTSICMPIEELLGSSLPEWGNLFLTLGVLLMALVIYQIMLRLVSRRISVTKKSSNKSLHPTASS
ncbi:hypothetical protein HW115_18865 [Verrucomicrobiaceae bacterium N1E253]|uniref:Uncharacterized protein n=1 Tax=Oceaniferula marina TaxID=2748318 RepID=A0A851GRP0_9BACT|nr:hypothetical protein [Oceaniferula marina]NWK57687.1 hypothetical protein [Oceaniferula marina]